MESEEVSEKTLESWFAFLRSSIIGGLMMGRVAPRVSCNGPSWLMMLQCWNWYRNLKRCCWENFKQSKYKKESSNTQLTIWRFILKAPLNSTTQAKTDYLTIWLENPLRVSDKSGKQVLRLRNERHRYRCNTQCLCTQQLEVSAPVPGLRKSRMWLF